MSFQSQKTTSDRTIPRWTKAKVRHFEVRLDLSMHFELIQTNGWGGVKERRRLFPVSLLSHFLWSLGTGAISKSAAKLLESWTEDKWTAESGQEAVGEEDLSEPASCNFSIFELELLTKKLKPQFSQSSIISRAVAIFNKFTMTISLDRLTTPSFSYTI